MGGMCGCEGVESVHKVGRVVGEVCVERRVVNNPTEKR